jgi:glycosyltransferase involved in cell wall biosynthesis
MKNENRIQYSIVVPIFNEEGSAATLYVTLTQVMRALGEPYEIVFVDDGSSDRSPAILEDIHGADSCVRVVTLRRNFGQTAALKAGFDAARGEVIISMDGDLQHNPAEIPSFIEKLDEGFDIVSGWRCERKDTWLTRRLPSRMANWAMAKLSGVALHDFGTTFKAYRREIIKNIQLYGELHRFIPALAAWYGARITEIPITNPPRQHGKSKYGLSRTFRVFLDLLSTKFLMDYSTRPLHFFGFFGLSATGAGILSGVLLLFQRLIAHSEILASNGSLTVAAIILIVAGVQIICLGLASEMLSRTYYESQKKPIYVTRATTRSDMNLGFRQEAVRSLEEGSGHSSERQANQHQLAMHSRAKSTMPVPSGEHGARPIARIRSFLVALILVGTMTAVVGAKAQSDRKESQTDVTAPVEPLPPDINENQLFSELLTHNELRNAALLGYTELRTYQVTDTTGKVRAQESGQMEYRAPDKKTFVTTSESGSGLVRRLALNPLIASEIEAAAGRQHHDSSITPANYIFELLGEQRVGPYQCFVVRARPKRPDKYLFEGKVWIDTQDYAVVRIAGHPAKKLSFWIERADFVREYQRIEGFWLPQRDETFVRVRMYGQKVLTIDHQNYTVAGTRNTEESAQNAEN